MAKQRRALGTAMCCDRDRGGCRARGVGVAAAVPSRLEKARGPTSNATGRPPRRWPERYCGSGLEMSLPFACSPGPTAGWSVTSRPKSYSAASTNRRWKPRITFCSVPAWFARIGPSLRWRSWKKRGHSTRRTRKRFTSWRASMRGWGG